MNSSESKNLIIDLVDTLLNNKNIVYSNIIINDFLNTIKILYEYLSETDKKIMITFLSEKSKEYKRLLNDPLSSFNKLRDDIKTTNLSFLDGTLALFKDNNTHKEEVKQEHIFQDKSDIEIIIMILNKIDHNEDYILIEDSFFSKYIKDNYESFIKCFTELFRRNPDEFIFKYEQAIINLGLIVNDK